MSQFDYPVGSFEYDAHERFTAEGISKVVGPLGAEAIIQIAARTHHEHIEAKQAEWKREAADDAIESINTAVTAIDSTTDELKKALEASVAKMTFAYSEVVNDMKAALDAFVEKTNDRIASLS